MKTIKSKSIQRIAWIIALVAVMVVAFAACKGGGGGGRASSGGSSSSSSSGGKISGTYVNEEWGLTYTFSGSKFTAEMKGMANVEGTFKVSGDDLTFIDKDGKEEKAKFTLEGNQLTIESKGFKIVYTKR